MGLDMYLSAKVYMSPSWGEKDEQKKCEKIREMFPEIKTTDNLDSVTVSFEAGYWRKANAIHSWFVDNVQDGADDCNKYTVYREGLKNLGILCAKVLANKGEADNMLPTQAGFFFGSTEYDEWFFKDLEDTIKIIEYALSLPPHYDFEYQSSW